MENLHVRKFGFPPGEGNVAVGQWVHTVRPVFRVRDPLDSRDRSRACQDWSTIRYPAFGIRYESHVPDTWNPVPDPGPMAGSRIGNLDKMVQGDAKYPVPGTWCRGPATRYRISAEGRTPSPEDRVRPPENAHTGYASCILYPFSTEHSSTRGNTQVLRDDGLIRRFPKPLTRLIAVLPYCPIAVLPYCRKNCPLGFDGSRGGDYHRDPANRSGLLPPGWGRESVRRRRWRSVVSTS